MKALLLIITLSLVSIASYCQDFNLYEEYEYTDIETAIVNKENAYRLRISGKSITEISPKIKQLTQLLEVTIENTEITELPKEFFELKYLAILNIRNNKKLTKIPEKINKLTSLIEINLYDSYIEKYPSFNGLTNLETLRISQMKPCNYPTGIGQLPKLNALSLSNFPEEELPNEYRYMNELNFLEFNHCGLKTIPLYLFDLVRLEVLWLHDASKLKKVEFPEKTDSKISSLSINGLHEFEVIGGFSSLKNLESLAIKKGKFKIMPQFDSNALKGIYFHSCTFDTLNLGVQHTTELEELTINNCSINTYLDGLSNMKKIKVLELSAWPFEKLPTEISSLKNLERLDISNTPTTKLDFLYHLKEMKLLIIWECSSLSKEVIEKLLVKHPDLKVSVPE